MTTIWFFFNKFYVQRNLCIIICFGLAVNTTEASKFLLLTVKLFFLDNKYYYSTCQFYIGCISVVQRHA